MAEFSMPVQGTFDALLLRNLGRCPLGLSCGYFDDLLVLHFHLRCVMNVVLQLRNSGSGTRLNGSRAARD